MTHLLFYGTFILFHTPDPTRTHRMHGEFEAESARQKNAGGEGTAMRPLLFIHPTDPLG
jgi:hypothetical protein